MKWDPGETWDEKRERLSQWHRVFAWWPTVVGPHDVRWLEPIERRGYYCRRRCATKIGVRYMWRWSWNYRSLRKINGHEITHVWFDESSSIPEWPTPSGAVVQFTRKK